MSTQNNEIMNLIISLDPFTDEHLNVYICRSRENDRGEVVKSEAPLYSPQSRKYIKAVFGPYSKRGYMSDAEARAVMEMIEGYALTQPIRGLSTCTQEVAEQKPLAQALRKLAEQGPTIDSAKGMLPKLNIVVRQHGIKVDPSTWPTTEDALGSQMADLVKIMPLMGVILIRHEAARPRRWGVYLEEDAPPDPGVAGVSDAPPSGSSGSGQSDTSASSDTTRGSRMLEYKPREAHPMADGQGETPVGWYAPAQVQPSHQPSRNGGRS
jgi:hypothetical protein